MVVFFNGFFYGFSLVCSLVFYGLCFPKWSFELVDVYRCWMILFIFSWLSDAVLTLVAFWNVPWLFVDGCEVMLIDHLRFLQRWYFVRFWDPNPVVIGDSSRMDSTYVWLCPRKDSPTSSFYNKTIKRHPTDAPTSGNPAFWALRRHGRTQSGFLGKAKRRPKHFLFKCASFPIFSKGFFKGLLKGLSKGL